VPEQFPHFELYEELEVSPRASAEVIQVAYQRLARLHHPDVNSGTDTGRMGRLNLAYEILNDSLKRADYDLLRTRSSRVRNAPPSGAPKQGAPRKRPTQPPATAATFAAKAKAAAAKAAAAAAKAAAAAAKASAAAAKATAAATKATAAATKAEAAAAKAEASAGSAKCEAADTA
jgi:curved DNA-binding protein CbpA